MASVRQAVCHVPGSTVPNRRFQSVRRLVQRELKYTHATGKPIKRNTHKNLKERLTILRLKMNRGALARTE